MKAADWIKKLNLYPHPEGGYYSEFYRSPVQFQPEGFDNGRCYSTAIYFLMEKGQFSALHRIKSDEVWHFYDGDPLEIIEVDESGNLVKTILGRGNGTGETITHVVKTGQWFGSRPAANSEFSLVGCTVSPGFNFADFEMPDQQYFLLKFPELTGIISEITRP